MQMGHGAKQLAKKCEHSSSKYLQISYINHSQLTESFVAKHGDSRV